jgi:RNA polymerase sigma-70 factor, ECF subfamily
VTLLDKEDLSPEQLAEQCKSGCPQAFDLLVQRFEERVFHYLCQLVHNQHDAEDLTQETFVKAYQAISRYEPRFTFVTWLFTIAKRSAYSHWRLARRSEKLPNTEEVYSIDPSTILEEKDEKNSIWQIARRLKSKQYEVLWLRYGEDFSIAEIARIMATNQIYVKVLLHRARHELAKHLRRQPNRVDSE